MVIILRRRSKAKEVKRAPGIGQSQSKKRAQGKILGQAEVSKGRRTTD